MIKISTTSANKAGVFRFKGWTGEQSGQRDGEIVHYCLACFLSASRRREKETCGGNNMEGISV